MAQPDPLPGTGQTESAEALAGAWDSLSDAKAKRRRMRLVAADFLERRPDVFGEEIATSMRPKP